MPGGHATATSEMQATLMENYVISGTCAGGTYQFMGRDGVIRKSGELIDALVKAGASEDDLWQFTMGISDTLSGVVGKFMPGAKKFTDLYCKGYSFGSTPRWTYSPTACS